MKIEYCYFSSLFGPQGLPALAATNFNFYLCCLLRLPGALLDSLSLSSYVPKFSAFCPAPRIRLTHALRATVCRMLNSFSVVSFSLGF